MSLLFLPWPHRHVWESKADGAFAISEDTWNESIGCGTEIRLHLREEAGAYLEETKLKELVKKYSEFINFPIHLWASKEVDVEVPADEDDSGDDEEKNSCIMSGKWSREPHREVILLFLRILALCHTKIPELIEETDSFNYEAESPNEGAFLVAARDFLLQKNMLKGQASIFSISVIRLELVLFTYVYSLKKFRDFKLLNLLDFNSKRKRMYVVIRDEDGQLLLLCKGADIYTAAGFSGRMPCAELADSIVQCGRRTLEATISFVNAHEKWKAQVIYGDTDSPKSKICKSQEEMSSH